ncbi:hypothetical protein C8J56DRAFT_28831 [Mycena floridula]|nr:hypothetical protein C8J56DRAFT_28831 [Mycena floridula]
MSRRESRVSARQPDILSEFEAFKKKCLLANKHIAKLNATLSVRINELTAQISILQAENAQLRSSEISLLGQLRREKDISRRIIAEAESAAAGLFASLRMNLNITSPRTSSPSPPRATRRPPYNPNPSPGSPVLGRIARPPNVPGIYEEDEPCLSDDQQLDEQPKSRKGRLSASKLPIPIRGLSPVPPRAPSPPPRQMDFTTMTKRPSRRQSGLLQVTRVATPEEDDEDIDEEEVVPKKEKEKEKRRAKATEWDARQPAEWDTQPKEEGPSASKKSKSGTNASTSGTRRKVLLPVDNIGISSPFYFFGWTKICLEAPTRTFLASSPPRTSRVPSPPSPQPSSSTHEPPAIHQPTSNSPYRPNSRSSPTPPPDSDLEGFAGDTESSTGGGRERRVRKSVNYTEPKLNTHHSAIFYLL